MVRAVFGMHGAGGNGSIQQGFGSAGDQPMHPDFYTMGGYDYGTTIQYRTPTGAQGQINGLPGCGGWNDPAGVGAYITAARAALESTLGVTVDAMIIHGFSYGGGGAQQLCAYGYTDGGRVKGYVCDDPVDSGNSRTAGNTMPIRFYYTNPGPLLDTPSAAARWGTTAIVNPIPGWHRPMTFLYGVGPNGIGCPPDETVAGGVINGITIPSMWTGGGGGEPPPVVTDAWPLYHAENGTLLSPQSAGIAEISNVATGAHGSGYIGQWYQSPEGIRMVVDPPAAGDYDLHIRFRQAAAAGSVRQLVVGGVSQGNHTFPQNSGTWEANSWTELTIPHITLVNAAQNVDLMYVSGSGPDVDEIRWTTAAGGGDPPTSAFEDKTNRPGHSASAYVGGWDEEDEAIVWPAVVVPTSGPYTLRFRYAAKPQTDGGVARAVTRHLYVDGVVHTHIVTFPATATGDTDDAWGTLNVNVASMSAGNHEVKLVVEADNFGLLDMDYLRLVKPGAAPNPGDPPDPNDPGTPPPTTGSETVVQAEAGTLSGVVAAAKVGTGYAGTSYSDGYLGGGYVGQWYQANETLTLTLTNPDATAGLYTLRFRYRNAGVAASRDFTVNGDVQTDLAFLPNAGAWSNPTFTNKVVYSVPLDPGANTIVLAVGSGGVDLDLVGFIRESAGGGGGGTPINVDVVVQAETGSFYDADPAYPTAIHTDIPGYSGSGFVRNDWVPGDTITLNIPIPVGGAGDYTLLVRYVNPENFSYSKNLTVNGVDEGVIGPFQPTAGGYGGAWQTQTHTVLQGVVKKIPLNAGNNSIVFETTAEYGEWALDWIQVTATIQGDPDDPPPPPPPTVGGATVISGIQLFPADFFGYADISALPPASDSAARIAFQATMPTYKPEWGTASYFNKFYPDFGSGSYNGRPFGFSYIVVAENATLYPISRWKYSWSQGESDVGPVPAPPDIPLEHNTDLHWIVLQAPHWLHEAWDATWEGSGWALGQYTKWDLRTNAMRPAGMTAADAAGLPMLPLSVRYEEVATGVVNHAMRMCVTYAENSYVWPANHIMGFDGQNGLLRPGDWLRIKSSVNLDAYGLGPQARIIAQAMKKHGVVVIDNGPNWKINACYHANWNNADLLTLMNLDPPSMLELVNVSSIIENSRYMSTTQA